MQVALACTPDFVLVQTVNTNTPPNRQQIPLLPYMVSLELSDSDKHLYEFDYGLYYSVVVCNITSDMYPNDCNKMFIILYHSRVVSLHTQSTK